MYPTTAGLALSLLMLALPAARADDRPAMLQNDLVRADFDGRGLTALTHRGSGAVARIAQDGLALLVGGESIDSLIPAFDKQDATTRTYRFESGPWRGQVVYELRPGWHFLTKQIILEAGPEKGGKVGRIEPFRGRLASPVTDVLKVRDSALLRLGPPGKPGDRGSSLFLLLQNPFLQFQREGEQVSAAYAPGLDWKPSEGPLASDRLCLGVVPHSGVREPYALVPEWNWVPESKSRGGPWIDQAELAALVDCVRAFLLVHPKAGLRVHVGWCENDYQIDVATPEGRAEYQRIIDQAAALGCRHLLFAPANSAVSSLDQNRDAWGWENLLWLGLGQKIRKGEWDPAKDPLPPSVKELSDYARARDVRFLAYVYPTLPFMQDPAWTRWIKGQPGGYLGADTGLRSYQDWLLEQLVAFHKSAGVSGYSFDHWWIAYDPPASSKYAQWAGCRRVLEELRRRVPDVVIDGRQQVHHFGPWTWLAGSYPHPLNSDEQPQSFRAFPDLHWSRASADRQRSTAWWYRTHALTPSEILPGYITHQTPRLDAKDTVRRDRYRPRDWDYLGWRYSLLSSIGTAPFNHVVNMIPARDPDEFKHFSDADKAEFRGWLDWADRNINTLRHLRPILGQPLIGRADGTAAFVGDRGFIFLFNPNYRPVPATFTLNQSIGLKADGPLLLRQLYPDAEKGRLLPPPGKPLWVTGDKVTLTLPGTDALVLQVEPGPKAIDRPLVLGTTGTAEVKAGELIVRDVTGECGAEATVQVVLPAGAAVKRATVNGVARPVKVGNGVAAVPVRFAGERLPRVPQVGAYDPQFTGGTFRGQFTLPARVVRQLEARKKAWPIPYTEDDLAATWTAPHRLLLYVQVAEPKDDMKVSLTIDGKPVALKKAYTSAHPQAVKNTFVGWYADVSNQEPDRPHAVAVELPPLQPGQFQGVFLDNVEAEFTKEVLPGGGSP